MQIKVKGISHIFDKGLITEQRALDKASVTINQGEFITIIGPTGSGKTTFIEHLNALIRPAEGEIEYISMPLAKKRKANIKILAKGQKISSSAMTIKPGRRKLREIKLLRKMVGVVFQFAEYQLFEETIEKDIIFGPISMGVDPVEAKNIAKKYIVDVGLPLKLLSRSPFSLSGGQKRRVALAGILAMEPDVMVFDEPTAGLDPQGEKDMYKIFHDLHKKGKTIIIVTHNLNHVLEHSDRTIVFNNGKLTKDDKSLKIMYDKKFLEDNDLEVPKIVNLVNELELKGKKIGMPKNIKELIKKI